MKTVTKKLPQSHLANLAALAGLRQDAASEVADLGSLMTGVERERFNETVRKRRDAVLNLSQSNQGFATVDGSRKGPTHGL